MASSQPSSVKPVLIKKYGNRRLYDTRQSCYITLEDLAEIIREGTEVKVIEASTNRDLTRQVLTQVILEHQESLEMIPIELLHAIIKVRGTLEQAPFSAFLAAVTRQFIDAGNFWSRQWGGIFNGRDDESPGRGRDASVTPSPDEGDAAPEGASVAPPQAATQATPTKDLDTLRRRMDALLNKLGRE